MFLTSIFISILFHKTYTFLVLLVIFIFKQLVDDSTNEATEQFEVELSSPSYGSKLGSVSKAAVLIDGPNDGELKKRNKRLSKFKTLS